MKRFKVGDKVVTQWGHRGTIQQIIKQYGTKTYRVAIASNTPPYSITDNNHYVDATQEDLCYPITVAHQYETQKVDESVRQAIARFTNEGGIASDNGNS